MRRRLAVAAIAVWTVTYLRHERGVRDRSGRARARLGVRDPAAVRRALEVRAGEADGRRSVLEPDVRRLAREAGMTVVAGCGDGSLLELVPATAGAVGLDLAHAAVRPAAKARGGGARAFLQADAARLPLRDGAADLVVLECVGRMERPEDAVWEAARVLRPGGRLVLQAPNACRAPAVRPLTHPFVWVARALGASRPWLVPGRGWTEPRPIDRDLRSDPDGPDAWLPSIEHVPQELVWLLRSAGFREPRWRSTGRARAGFRCSTAWASA